MDIARRPEWLKKKIDFDSRRTTDTLLTDLGLATVCGEARCPNASECFKDKHATFLILGKRCTRRCRFCHIDQSALPEPPDLDEPRRVALAVQKLGLRHAVVTSVTRDDLPDGGAMTFAETARAIRALAPSTTIELLIPDFGGSITSLETVAKDRPDIIGHNLETVPRLYALRPGADYKRSLELLARVKKTDNAIKTKSSLMLGLGERAEEVIQVLKDLRKEDCDFLTLGQYLRPSLEQIDVAAYITPQQFETYRSIALALGFRHVASGPYVRSSYRAAEALQN
jgi:lipoic acid synthetase